MRRSYKKRTGIGIIAFVVLILCAIVSYRRIGLGQELNEKEITVSRLEDKKQEELERKEEISEYKAYTKTRKYIEDMARVIWGLVYEDEIVFEPEEK